MRLVILLLLIYTSVFAYEQESELICAITSKMAKFTRENNTKINPYTITVLHNQFNHLFSKTFKNIKIYDKRVQILYINNIHNLQSSNILFFFDTPPNELDKVLNYIKGKHILTISTMRGFTQRGGMIQIYAKNQKLKLNINLDNVKKEGIYINSALLRIAHIIKGNEND